MQETSALYRQILAGDHWYECALAYGEAGRLITKQGESITFGGTSILIGRSGGDAGYQEDYLYSIETTRAVFAEDNPAVGCCIAGEIDVKMRVPAVDIPRMAQIVPYVRICNSESKSEWIQKGVYYIDTRDRETFGEEEVLHIHGFDAILKAEAEFDTSRVSSWPATDANVISGCAAQLDVSIDSRTWDIVNKNYSIPMRTGYSVREILGFIAAMYAGCWVMNDFGQLMIIALNGLPKETNYLVDHVGDAITFGGDRILV